MSKKQMLINYVPGEQCRIAIVEDGKLQELYRERAEAESRVGNIYKGKVLNIESSIQAVFIDFGQPRNGFLHVSDLHPKYFPGESREKTERVGKKTPRRDRPPIQACLKRGQDILVQVLKEGIGTKGPTLTSYLSIPGRFLVMMPDMQRLGVSRKTEDIDLRREMRDLLNELSPPEGFGFIVRTAGLGRPKTDLKRDLAYLQRLWKAIDRRMNSPMRVGELYTESDLLIRTLRDVFTTELDSVIVDDVEAARRARDFLSIASPRSTSKVMVYRDPIPMFHRYGLEEQIEGISQKTVDLPSGGSLVIEQTEALVAIDVNSGKMRDPSDAETTAYKTNCEATDEICRQLRLRDLGGVVVNDLIDMRSSKHRRAIENRFRQNLKDDRAKTRINPITQFGLLEMTRQRMRPSLRHSIYIQCPRCTGQGQIKSPQSLVVDAMRLLALAVQHKKVSKINLTVSADVAAQLLNRKRGQMAEFEKNQGKVIEVHVNPSINGVRLLALDDRGGAVNVESLHKQGEPNLEPVDSVPSEPVVEPEESTETPAEVDGGTGKKRKRRRRGSRGRGKRSSGTSEQAQQAQQTQQTQQAQQEDASASGEQPRQSSPSGQPRQDESESDRKQADQPEPSASKAPKKKSSAGRTRSTDGRKTRQSAQTAKSKATARSKSSRQSANRMKSAGKKPAVQKKTDKPTQIDTVS